MPTIHRQEGFRFLVYVHDHGPPHVHVWYAGARATIWIGDPAVKPTVRHRGAMRVHDVLRGIRIVERAQQKFLAEWEVHHGT